jgi:hypothetical protein
MISILLNSLRQNRYLVANKVTCNELKNFHKHGPDNYQPKKNGNTQGRKQPSSQAPIICKKNFFPTFSCWVHLSMKLIFQKQLAFLQKPEP